MILNWRNSKRVRVNMYNDRPIARDEHDAWFDRALAADSARYLVFEYAGRPVGFVSFTYIDRRNERCTWAYYLGEVDVPKGCGAAMEFLALAHAFDELRIRKLCCEVLSFNRAVCRMHLKFGFRQEGTLERHVGKAAGYEDVVLLALFRETWNAHRNALHERCFGAEGA